MTELDRARADRPRRPARPRRSGVLVASSSTGRRTAGTGGRPPSRTSCAAAVPASPWAFGLGALVEPARRHRGARRRAVPRSSSRPACSRAAAMQTAVGESTLSGDGGRKWQRQYHAMTATPLGAVRRRASGTCVCDRAASRDRLARSFVVVVAACWGVPSPLADRRCRCVAVLCGAARVRRAGHGLLARPGERLGVRRCCSGSALIPMFLFSGTFFPVAQLPAGSQPLAWLIAAVARRRLARAADARRHAGWPRSRHCAYLLLLGRRRVSGSPCARFTAEAGHVTTR